MLGAGSYGEVFVRKDKAIKKFTKIPHIVQEYTALNYLSDCKYIVKTNGVDFNSFELSMDLYDCSLRKWIEEKREKEGGISNDNMLKILHDVISGLVELHDRDLAHGDVKPGNILVKKNPFRCVLGDCGFVSIAKYAKVDRTAPIYRDPIIDHSPSHDMYSLGIIFLELVADIKINRQATYDELKEVIRSKVTDPDYQKIIYYLVHDDRSKRPTSRKLLQHLFKEEPPVWVKPVSSVDYTEASVNTSNLPRDDRYYIRSLIKNTAYRYEINRGKKGYAALLTHIDKFDVREREHTLYVATTLLILSSLFGKSGFREQEVLDICGDGYKKSHIYDVLERLLTDHMFINIILSPQLKG